MENKFVMYRYTADDASVTLGRGDYFKTKHKDDTQSTTDSDYTLTFKTVDEAGVYLILNQTTESNVANDKNQYLSKLTIEEAPSAEITQLEDKKYNIKIKDLNEKYPISKISIVWTTSASETEIEDIKKLKVDNLENPTIFEFDCEFITESDLKYAKVKLEYCEQVLYYNLTN